MQRFPYTDMMATVTGSDDPDVDCIVMPEVAMHLDARHFPVLIATWFGVPNPDIVLRYGEWLERMAALAAAEDTRLAVLGDITGFTERPGPDVRRAMAAAIERLQERHPGRILGVTTIIDQPVMRAVITMVLAITRRTLDLRPVKDFEQALARTFALLDEAGIPRPKELDAATYRRPSRPQ